MDMGETERRLKTAWDSIDYKEGGSLLLGIQHPLEWHVSYSSDGTSKQLVIISKYPIQNIESSKSITTMCNLRSDGRYFISFQLAEPTQEDVFISMCSNIIAYSSNALTEKDAIKKVAERYRQWRRLMQRKNMGILSDEMRKGLAAELIHFQEVIKERSIEEALEGWVGPDGADQDFVYDGIWTEVKATGLSSDKITIHSLEQLGKQDDEGILLVYRIDKCSSNMSDSFTLPKLISTIISQFNNDLDAEERFNGKLNDAGYINMDIYEKYSYKCFDRTEYSVDKRFPRITRDTVPSEIGNCEYSLDLLAIDSWKKG